MIDSKKMKRIGVLLLLVASTVLTLADDAAWSKPVHGLRARLSVLPPQDTNTPFCRVFIELQNVEEVLGQRKIRFSPDKLTLSVSNKAGKALSPVSRNYDGFSPVWETIALPYAGTIRFQISFPGLGYRPAEDKAIIDVGPDKSWVIPQDGSTYFLSGSLTIESRESDHPSMDWSGTLELPGVAIPKATPQSSKAEAAPPQGTARNRRRKPEPKTPSSEPVLQQAQTKLAPILAKLNPKPTIEYQDSAQSLVVQFRPQKFLVHAHSMTGEWFTNVAEVTGPSFKGFVLTIQLQPRGYENQAVTPQTLRDPYWRTFLDLTPVAGTTNQLFWALSFGADTDKHLLDNLKKALRSLAGTQKAGLDTQADAYEWFAQVNRDGEADLTELLAQLGRRIPVPAAPSGPPDAHRSEIFATSARWQLRADLYWTDPENVDMKDDGFSVTFGQHVLRGERQALTLDGINVASIPLTLTNINVFVTNFTLLVLGNGAPLVTNKLAR